MTLPSRSDMEADIAQKEMAMSHRYVSSKRHTIQVDYLPFMDELAELTGNKPNLGRYTKFRTAVTPLSYKL